MRPWWATADLSGDKGQLMLGGAAVADLARAHGTPLYLYSRAAVSARIQELRDALSAAGAPWRIYYAMKANRCPGILGIVRAAGDLGLDACSPREAALALQSGFAPTEISVTAGMLSNADLDSLAGAGVHLNLDSLSALRRYGARVPGGTRVGLRVDPAVEVGYDRNPKLGYANSKFGFEAARVEEAAEAASRAGLVVDTLHLHCGWGLQMRDRELVGEAFRLLARLARKLPGLEVLNVGGGLGARHRAGDEPLAPEAWSDLLRRHLAALGLTIACEPGTFLVHQAGLLVAEVNTVEVKAGVTWVGVNAGHNLNVYPYHYAIPLEIVHVGRPYGEPSIACNVAGNINEAGDIFARGVRLPSLVEGDLLALLPAGAYGASMASDHCLRGGVAEVVV